jgi:hypothetical protein
MRVSEAIGLVYDDLPTMKELCCSPIKGRVLLGRKDDPIQEILELTTNTTTRWRTCSPESSDISLFKTNDFYR